MRDRDRMEQILVKIMRGWRGVPDLRLGQLLLNVTSLAKKDLYYVEDKELANLVFKFLGGIKESDGG